MAGKKRSPIIGEDLRIDCRDVIETLSSSLTSHFLIKGLKEFVQLLGVYDHNIDGFYEDFGVQTHVFDSVLKTILMQWTELNGKNATLEALCSCLVKMNVNGSVADQLRSGARKKPVTHSKPQLDQLYYGRLDSDSDAKCLYDCPKNARMKYFNHEILGWGNNNTVVFKGLFSDRKVAIKRINCRSDGEKKVIQEINNLLASDSHENVVRCFGGLAIKYLGDLSEVYIALELCDATLTQYISGQHQLRIDKRDVLLQITSGISHLHSQRIIHGDLHPNNILLLRVSERQVRVKISDFGLSQTVSENNTTSELDIPSGQPLGWLAPETLKQGSHMSFQSDIFTLGIIYYYILSNGHHLYGQTVVRQENIVNNRPQLNLDAEKFSIYPWLSLILGMVKHDPKYRPSATAILHHHAFWNTEKTLQFLLDVCNCLEHVPEDSNAGRCLNKPRNTGNKEAPKKLWW